MGGGSASPLLQFDCLAPGKIFIYEAVCQGTGTAFENRPQAPDDGVDGPF